MDLTKKPPFSRGDLVQVQYFGTDTKYDLEIFHHFGKRVKNKGRKFCGLIPKFVEVTGEKVVWGAFCPSLS